MINMFIYYPGVEKVLLSLHKAISHWATNWHPAAVATPLTLAITGSGQSIILIINCEAKEKTFSCCFLPNSCA